MHAIAMCIRGIHNEPIFTTIVKEPLLLGLWTLVLFAHHETPREKTAAPELSCMLWMIVCF
jgi:hypothetical protein